MHPSWTPVGYVRYRSTTNPDLGDHLLPQAITLNDVTAIPKNGCRFRRNRPQFQRSRQRADSSWIVNIARLFILVTIEQGGSSLYAVMSQKATAPEVLQITLWHRRRRDSSFPGMGRFPAGNGVQRRVASFTDSVSGPLLPNFFNPLNPLIQPSLIFPVPCEFISAEFTLRLDHSSPDR